MTLRVRASASPAPARRGRPVVEIWDTPLLVAEAAPDSFTSCRVCGYRIMKGERRLMWVGNAGRGYYRYGRTRSPLKFNRRGAHLDCLLGAEHGRAFISGLMQMLSDEELDGLGFDVTTDVASGLEPGDILRIVDIKNINYAPVGTEFRFEKYTTSVISGLLAVAVQLSGPKAGVRRSFLARRFEFVRRP